MTNTAYWAAPLHGVPNVFCAVLYCSGHFTGSPTRVYTPFTRDVMLPKCLYKAI